VSGELYLRGFCPNKLDNPGLYYFLDFIVEDEFGSKMLYTSEGGCREADEIDVIFSRMVGGRFQINPEIEGVFQRGNMIYVALRKNQDFARRTITFIRTGNLG